MKKRILHFNLGALFIKMSLHYMQKNVPPEPVFNGSRRLQSAPVNPSPARFGGQSDTRSSPFEAQPIGKNTPTPWFCM